MGVIVMFAGLEVVGNAARSEINADYSNPTMQFVCKSV
jgi:hypothetical protein